MISNKAQQFLSGRVGREGNPSERTGEEGGGLKKRVRYFQLTLSSDWNSLL